MADAAIATAPTATPAPAPATAAEAPAVDIVEQAFERIGAEVAEEEARSAETQTEETPAEGEHAAEAQAEEKKPEPAEKTAAELEAADEALFADAALKTPAGIKAAADRLRALRSEVKQTQGALAKKQREVDHDFRVLRKKEASFKNTKQQHLAWHTQQREQAQLLGQHVNMVFNGTPQQAAESLGFLRGKDGITAFEELVTTMSGLRKGTNPETEAIRRDYEQRFAALEQRLQGQQLTAQLEERRAQVAQLEAKVIETAKDATQYPALAHFVTASPREVVAELKSMRKAYLDENGEPLPMAQAMLALNEKLAPYLPAGGGGAGQPRVAQTQNPGGQSSPSSSTKSPGGVAGIPPSASARVAAVRPITEDERRQELTPEFFADIGLW
jgi:hypothetical protein